MTVGPVARDDATAEFFDGTAAGKLLLRRCDAGHFSEPAVAQCTTCGSDLKKPLWPYALTKAGLGRLSTLRSVGTLNFPLMAR